MKKTSKNRTLGIIAGVSSAVFVAGYITVNKLIYSRYDISALDYTLLFAVLGGLYALLSLLVQGRAVLERNIKGNQLKLATLGVAGFLAVGIMVFGQQYTTAVNVALIMTLTIVATTIFSYLLLGDKMNKAQWFWSGILFVGLYIGIVGFKFIDLNAGDLIVLSSIVFFGFGNAYSRVVMKNMESPGVAPDSRLVVSGAIALVISLFVVDDFTVWVDVLPLAAISGLSFWLCIKTFARAVYLLNANTTIVLNNSQIFFTSLGGVIILSEPYNIEKFLGSVIAIVSIYFITKQH